MRRLGSAALAVLGLWIIAEAVIYLAQSSMYLRDFFKTEPLQVVPFVVGLAIVAVLGLMLILERDRVSAWLFPDDEVAVTLDAESALIVGIAMTGLWLGTRGAATAAGATGSLVSILFPAAGPDSGYLYVPMELGAVVTPAVTAITEVVLGLILLTRARKIAARVLRVPVNQPAATLTEMRCLECGAAYDPADYRSDSTAHCGECQAELPSPAPSRSAPHDR